MAELELQAVSKTYLMGRAVVQALQEVDLCIGDGDYVALTGPSGSGKSTLLNLLGCLDTPTSGRYLLSGRDVSTLTPRELAAVRNREIGFVFQRFHLLPRKTALENVEVPLRLLGMASGPRRTRAAELLASVGLADRADHRPEELSGGQQQRVAIARAMANRPGLILADEPTGNLDSTMGHEIVALLERLVDAGHTIVLVTHEPTLARRAKRIVQLRDGRIEP